MLSHTIFPFFLRNFLHDWLFPLTFIKNYHNYQDYHNYHLCTMSHEKVKHEVKMVSVIEGLFPMKVQQKLVVNTGHGNVGNYGNYGNVLWVLK